MVLTSTLERQCTEWWSSRAGSADGPKQHGQSSYDDLRLWWRWGAHGERAAWSSPSSTCRPSTTQERRRGQLCCLSARPHDLADIISARPEMACVPISYLPCLYSKSAALTRDLVSSYRQPSYERHFVHTPRPPYMLDLLILKVQGPTPPRGSKRPYKSAQQVGGKCVFKGVYV